MSKNRMWIRADIGNDGGLYCTDDTEFMLFYEREEYRRYWRLHADFVAVEGKELTMYVCVPKNVIAREFAKWYWRMKQDGRFSKYRLD